MTRPRLSVAMTLVALISVFVAGIPTAMAASTTLYLRGDGVPGATMSASPPPSMQLPDYDGSGDRGRKIDKSGNGSSETNPGKHQRWEHHAEGGTITVQDLVIWAAPKDFDVGKEVRFTAWILDCDPTCDYVAHASKTLDDTDSWKSVTLTFGVTHTFKGKVVVKVTVSDQSDDDMWFAYGTNQYPASLKIVYTGAPTTTTTAPATTTTTAPVTPTTTAPHTTTTTDEANVEDELTLGVSEPGPMRVSPVLVLSMATPEDSAIGAIDPGRLRPQEGLKVAFSTATEMIESYWGLAVSLGGLMTLLLMVGFKRVNEDVSYDSEAGE